MENLSLYTQFGYTNKCSMIDSNGNRFEKYIAELIFMFLIGNKGHNTLFDIDKDIKTTICTLYLQKKRGIPRIELRTSHTQSEIHNRFDFNALAKTVHSNGG